MTQERIWDREYRKSQLLTLENKPQQDVVRFVKWLKKMNYPAENPNVLDLGSGTGRNSFYFTELGAKVTGLEISKTAIDLAKDNAKSAGYDIKYIKQSIGEIFPFKDSIFDIALDITSSNSLTEAERNIYLIEAHRVLKKDGYFFVKALCKEGDPNAKNLLKAFPGNEKDTYVMPDLGVTERVWNKEDFLETYSKYFQILELNKKTNYSRMNGRSYKRNFWICYMKK